MILPAAATSPRSADAVVAALAEAAYGVVAGQVEDVAGSRDVPFVYAHKTADLFVAAAVMGGFAGGGSDYDIRRLRTFAFNLGMAFQYQDDILDGDSPYGEEKTAALAKEATDAALAALAGLPGDTTPLSCIASGLLNRRV